VVNPLYHGAPLLYLSLADTASRTHRLARILFVFFSLCVDPLCISVEWRWTSSLLCPSISTRRPLYYFGMTPRQRCPRYHRNTWGWCMSGEATCKAGTLILVLPNNGPYGWMLTCQCG